MKKNKKNVQKDEAPRVSLFKHLIFVCGIICFFLYVQDKVFKKEVDVNGDNATYYIGAKAIAQGDGYVNILTPQKTKTNSFPPGYPLLMAGVIKVKDTFEAQKVMNSIFLLMACLLLYFIVFFAAKNRLIALVAALLPASNYLVLHFTGMMMSEPSFIFFSTLAVFAIFRLKEVNDWKSIIKDPFLWLIVFASEYAFHIRTQGISLILAVMALFLLTRRWKHGILYFAGTAVLMLPWIIRNKVAGIESRYFHQIMSVNHWRPEEGLMSFRQIIERMFKTTKMLITQAIPDSIIPNYKPDYKVEPEMIWWFIGVGLILFIVLGFWNYFKEKKWFFIMYLVFTCGIITLWSAPSQNRYLTTIVPFMQIGAVLGILTLFSFIFSKLKLKIPINIVLIVGVLASFNSFSKDVQSLSERNNKRLHPAYRHFMNISKEVKKKYPKGDVVVCSRKPALFFLNSNTFNVRYAYSLNDTIVINDLLKKDVDFVVLDQLGYSSTKRYLYPAIKKNGTLFKTVIHYKKPDTYLLYFNKERALRLGFTADE